MATIKKDIGAYSAYAIAVKHGYVGTEAEWVAAQEKARVDSEAAAKAAQAAREQAQTAKTGAETAQTAAAQAAQTATGAASAATQAAQVAQTAKKAAEQAQSGAQNAKTRAETANTEAQAAKTAAEEAAQEAKAAQTGAVEAKTGAEEAQGKAEEAAQGVAADREQIGANKSGLETAQQELTATKQQLTETKAALTTTQEDLAKAQRAIQFQAALNKGQTWDFEEDTQEAYQRTVPSGAKAGAVMEWGGKTVGWNQLASIKTAASTDINSLNVKIPTSAFRLTHKYYFSDTATESDGTDFTFTTVGFWNATVDKYLRVETTGTRKNGKSAIVASWSSLPEGVTTDDLTNIVFQYIGANSAEDSRVSAQNLTVVDLTILYGPGNEPTDTTDPRIAQIEAYAAAHPEFNAGELVSALVDEVRVRGKNLLDYKKAITTGHSKIIDGGVRIVNVDGSGERIVMFPVKIKKGTTYHLRVQTKIVDGNWPISAYLPTVLQYLSFSKSFVANGDDKFIGLYLDSSRIGTVDVTDIQLEESPTATAYSPYHLDTYPIPDAVKQLPGYGWSAGSVANTIERTDTGWQFVQRVETVDLGTLDYTKEENTFRAKIQGMQIVSTDVPFNGRCKSFISIRYRDNWTVDGTMSQDSSKRLVLIHSGYSDIASFLSYVRGTPLYYELATPITTDITALMGDSLAPFAVEAGGSITLHHPAADDGFAIDVPAKIQYIIKLSEVSANG